MGAGASRPALLAIANQVPWPLDRGGHLRSYHLLRALAGRFRVRLLAGVHAAEREAAVAALRAAGVEVVPVPLGARSRWGEARRAAAAALHGEPYVLYRRHHSAARWRALRDLLCSGVPDVFYLDHLNSLTVAPLCSGAPRVMDQNSVCSTMVRRAAAHAPPAVRPWVLHQARLLERMEQRAARAVDLLFGVATDEVRYFATCGARARLVPNGVDSAAYAALPVAARPGSPLLLFVGDMSWAPNVAAAAHLAGTILPTVRTRYPDAHLRIVGRAPTTAARALRTLPHVEVTGTVPDVRPHLAAAHLLAVPLTVGSGTRIKILEAFAAGLPVVSTPLGCEGLAVTDGLHLSVARHEQFTAAVLAMLADPEEAARRAAQARALVRSAYDWTAVGAQACTAIEGLLHNPSVPRRSALFP